MGGIASLLYGALAYLLFLGTFLYAIAFVGNLPVPKTIDSGAAGPLVPALDHQHAAARTVRHSAQRHGAAGIQALVDAVRAAAGRANDLRAAREPGARSCSTGSGGRCPTPVWSVTNPVGVAVLQAIFWIGWAVVLISTFLINHFELFGLRQVYARLRGQDAAGAGVQDAVPLQEGPASDLSRLPARLLGDAVHDGGPSAVRDRDHRLHPDRHLAGGARPDRACSATSTAAIASRSRCLSRSRAQARGTVSDDR